MVVVHAPVGSNPTTHPNYYLMGRRQVVRQWILIPSCAGSNPAALANFAGMFPYKQHGKRRIFCDPVARQKF